MCKKRREVLWPPFAHQLLPPILERHGHMLRTSKGWTPRAWPQSGAHQSFYCVMGPSWGWASWGKLVPGQFSTAGMQTLTSSCTSTLWAYGLGKDKTEMEMSGPVTSGDVQVGNCPSKPIKSEREILQPWPQSPILQTQPVPQVPGSILASLRAVSDLSHAYSLNKSPLYNKCRFHALPIFWDLPHPSLHCLMGFALQNSSRKLDK